MAIEITYTSLRARLASVLDKVVNGQETVIVRRRGAGDVALMPAEELAGLMETGHLLCSPQNAKRLLTALRRADRRSGKPETVRQLRRELGLERTNEMGGSIPAGVSTEPALVSGD